MRKTERRPIYRYWQAKYWPTWLGLGFLRVVSLLPYSWQLTIGRCIGRAAHAAGMTVIQVPDIAAPSREVLALGHRVVASLEEVLELV